MTPAQQQQLQLLLAELARLGPVAEAWLRRQPDKIISIEVHTPGLPPLTVEWQRSS
tara:strand:- start:360 stop:527 length:168 start_codon:yes stop_codon:yes gene_type:complete